jgi:hypothetical protein
MRCQSLGFLVKGLLALALVATLVNTSDGQLFSLFERLETGKPGKAAFVIEELTTAEFRKQHSPKFAAPEARQLESQVGIIVKMATGAAPADYRDSFPYLEYKMVPGKYRLAFKLEEAAWTNRIKVGTVKEMGQPNFDREFGAIDNRGARGDVVFTLTEVAIVRFEVWTDQPGRGWHHALVRCHSYERMLNFEQEDGGDSPGDWNDLMVYFHKVN